MIETYTRIKKNNELKYLKIYYSLYKTKSKKDHSIKRFRLDYDSKLQSHKANK